ncbi:MAG: phage tail tip lysozyme, partial [Candidatus Nanopelagicaceae bacterium]
NWFVNECEYKWRDGDLRVQLEGVSQWGTGMTQVPLFSKYLESMRATGEIKMSSSYYDYIRSLGTLSWKTDNGKDSTEVFCKEAQELSKFLSEGTESSGSPDVSGSFPTANCQNPSSPAQNAVMGALRSAGINTQNAYAGVLGNIQEESGFDPNVHNTPRQGLTCLSVSGAREKCYGLVQWGGSRKVAALSKCGQTSSLQCQLEFMVQEIGARGGGMVEELNNAKSPAEAAVIWARKYEVSDIAFDSRRVRNANAIFPQLKCDRST